MYADRIKQLRTELGLSVAKMADKMGMPQSTLTGYERNERVPSAPFFTRLYETFDVNLNWFASGNGEIFNKKPFEQVEDQLEQKVLEVMKKYGVIEK